MNKSDPTCESLGKTAQVENSTLIGKIARWIRNFLENAE